MRVFSSILLAVAVVTLAVLVSIFANAEAFHRVSGLKKSYPNPNGKPYPPGVKKQVGPFPSKVINPTPKYDANVVPRSFDWSDTNKLVKNVMQQQLNQHIPQYCGSCWGQGSTAALEARIAIARYGAFPPVRLAIQTLVNCVPDGCDGSTAFNAYKFIEENGIADSTCRQYDAKGTGMECTPMNKCQNCKPGGVPCNVVTDYIPFTISEYGQALGEEAMMSEIYHRGPIACGIDAGPVWDWGFNQSNRGHVFDQGKGLTSIDHVIYVYGFGEEKDDQGNMVPVWYIQNSWGTYWGTATGTFALRRGQNQLGIESYPCAWAVPKIPKEYNNSAYKPDWWKN